MQLCVRLISVFNGGLSFDVHHFFGRLLPSKMLRYSLAFLLFLSICEANVQDEKLVKARIEVKKRYKDILHMVDILIIFYSEL